LVFSNHHLNILNSLLIERPTSAAKTRAEIRGHPVPHMQRRKTVDSSVAVIFLVRDTET
jgi:hypothetical protein